MLKKLFFAVIAALCVAPSLHAQVAGQGWPQRQSQEQISIDPSGQNITIDKNTYAWRPFDRVVGYSLYGSRYRKAVASKGWGIFLSCVVAPVAAVGTAYALDGWTIRAEWCLAGAALVGGGILAVSIPMWSRGQKELDWMLDDYAQRFGPKPYSASLKLGPTNNGMGLALNF